MGRREQAEAHFEDAIAFCSKADYRPKLAWSLCDDADLLPGRSPALEAPEPADLDAVPPENRQHAMALLDEALAISRELGMRPRMEHVLARREILRT